MTIFYRCGCKVTGDHNLPLYCAQHGHADDLPAILVEWVPERGKVTDTEQDCGLSANDIYQVMLAWEQQPASEEQTRIVTGLGKLREQFIQRGDSPYVTVPTTARVAPQEQILMALEAAQQFLDPAVPRGPDIDGWRNTVDLVNTILAAHRAPPTQEPTSPTDPARDP